jgi:hypothetical protein
MKRAYCWRCKNFIVVIEDIDQMEFDQLYAECLERVKQYREHKGVALSDAPVRELFTPVYRFYEDRGGDTTVGHVEFYKHRERNFGPSCSACGKNFRTQKASFCAECGYRSKTD